jgi:hypothetical protein
MLTNSPEPRRTIQRLLDLAQAWADHRIGSRLRWRRASRSHEEEAEKKATPSRGADPGPKRGAV